MILSDNIQCWPVLHIFPIKYTLSTIKLRFIHLYNICQKCSVALEMFSCFCQIHWNDKNEISKSSNAITIHTLVLKYPKALVQCLHYWFQKRSFGLNAAN